MRTATTPSPREQAPRRTRARRGEGDRLRRELIEVAAALFEHADGPDHVSMAAIAAEVGCTQPAIYMHFESKQALVLAAYETRFRSFRTELLKAESRETSPLEALIARGHAYIRWGLENPAAYRMLFMHPTPQPVSGAPDEIQEHTEASFQDQVDAVRRCIEVGVFPGGDAKTIATALWASTHGLVALKLAKPDFEWPDNDELTRTTLFAHGLGIDVDLRST